MKMDRRRLDDAGSFCLARCVRWRPRASSPQKSRARLLNSDARRAIIMTTIDPGPSGEDAAAEAVNLAMSDRRVLRECARGPVDVVGPDDPFHTPRD
jgi:hypothetical protein